MTLGNVPPAPACLNLQCDAPAQLAQLVRLTAAGQTSALCTLGGRPDGAVLVDQTSSDGVPDTVGDLPQ